MTIIEGKVIAVSAPIPYIDWKYGKEIPCYIKMVIEAQGKHMLTFFSGRDNSINRLAKNVEELPRFILVSLTQVGDVLKIEQTGSGIIMSIENVTKGISSKD